MILKHQAKRLLGARQAVTTTSPTTAEKSALAPRAKGSVAPKRRASR